MQNRRNFIGNSAKAAALAIAAGSSSLFEACNTVKKAVTNYPDKFKTGFIQTPLPYAYNALENIIDAQTMELHYSKHAAAYVKNMNDALAESKVDVKFPRSVETILSTISNYNVKLRNNAGGHYNHEMFWQCMRPGQVDNKPTGKLSEAIKLHFTSFDNFKKQFTDAAKNRFGSGWAWLYTDGTDKNKSLKIGSTPNQDNPLMDVSDIKGFPLLALDVWEHAYYLKYQNKRADYIENWWQVVNWEYVQQRFEAI